ncbi:hypothetical protein ILYODFUR_021781 [Ilyodon furcidens]|uniref:Uncharacterized protein n=1 Tax=Ilyodon furcidens TaxID=33524 RepID=A0ABV0TN40_9TELE
MMWFCWRPQAVALSGDWSGPQKSESSKSEAKGLNYKNVNCSLWIGGQSLSQSKTFKYLCVLFMSDERMEFEMDGWTVASAAVMIRMPPRQLLLEVFWECPIRFARFPLRVCH